MCRVLAVCPAVSRGVGVAAQRRRSRSGQQKCQRAVEQSSDITAWICVSKEILRSTQLAVGLVRDRYLELVAIAGQRAEHGCRRRSRYGRSRCRVRCGSGNRWRRGSFRDELASGLSESKQRGRPALERCACLRRQPWPVGQLPNHRRHRRPRAKRRNQQLDLAFALVPRRRQQLAVVVLGEVRREQPDRSQCQPTVGEARQDTKAVRSRNLSREISSAAHFERRTIALIHGGPPLSASASG